MHILWIVYIYVLFKAKNIKQEPQLAALHFYTTSLRAMHVIFGCIILCSLVNPATRGLYNNSVFCETAEVCT